MAKGLGLAFKFGAGFRLSKDEDLQRLIENWHSLPHRTREAILILGHVRTVSRKGTKANTWPVKRGETPEWLATAVNILKDSGRYLTDREIAEKVGVNPSTLCRNETYVNAKKTYLQPFLTIGRRGIRKNSKL